MTDLGVHWALHLMLDRAIVVQDSCQLYQVNSDLLGWWFYERQLTSGGLNGRLEKLSAVCYSWWVLVSVKIAGSAIGLAETDGAVSCERVMMERLEILPIGQEVW